MSWIKPATLKVVLPNYLIPFLLFMFIWIVTSFITGKYNPNRKTKKLQNFIKSILKSNFVVLSIILIIIFWIHYQTFSSRIIIFGTIIGGTLFEIFYAIVFFYSFKTRNEYDVPSNKLISSSFPLENGKIEIEQISFPKLEKIEDSIYVHLINRYLADKTKLFTFIDQSVDLLSIRKERSQILNSHHYFNIQHIDQGSQELFMNLHKINDIQRINQYFIKVNENLQKGGVFIGCVLTHEIERELILDRFPAVFNKFYYYFIHFPLKRIIPKLPYTKEVYFFFTKGKNRTISRPEILGRLYSCGFKSVAEKLIDFRWYFIALKIKEPYYSDTPSYGPLIKLKRIGQNGKIFNVYKFRTMFPFSEYIQEYVYLKNNLQNGGKFKDDFRVSTIGQIMRKLWIDELPMVINIFKGNMKLVGVRPLSEHYFKLYSEDLQKQRIKFKPGLVPPFYADLPETLEQIMDSEKKYLDRYEKNPFITDFIYFFKAIFNIIFKKARSNLNCIIFSGSSAIKHNLNSNLAPF